MAAAGVSFKDDVTTNVRQVHELFEGEARCSPQKIAVQHGMHQRTYGQLNDEAKRIARLLIQRGVKRGDVVGVLLERSILGIATLLAVLKTGAAYLPLDPTYPRDRLRHMLEDAQPRALCSHAALLQRVPSCSCQAAIVDVEATAGAREDIGASHEVAQRGDGADPVYVIYTSGSTGRPKGTTMPHAAMMNLIAWHQHTLPAHEMRVLQFAALSFDVAFQEIFTTLCGGGTLILVDEWVRRDSRALLKLLVDQGIQRLFIPPMMLRSLAEAFSSTHMLPAELRDVIVAGDVLRVTPEIVELFAELPEARLHNHYGPTETHVVTALTLTGDPHQWPALPSIGTAIANTRIYILDENGRPVRAEATGEIYIAGAGVASGYLNRPELTAERFLIDRFDPRGTERMYRTGDLAHWRKDGALEFLGRSDSQVKIRGFRVETSEVEVALCELQQVAEAAVLAHDDPVAGRRLFAYVVARDAEAMEAETLRSQLAAKLPGFMIPSVFVGMERLPLSPNGKLDRLALPSPTSGRDSSAISEAPREGAEALLADIWRSLLGRQSIERTDNFFELGGDSMLIVQMMEQVRKKGIEIDVRDVYKAATLGELAQSLIVVSDSDLASPSTGADPAAPSQAQFALAKLSPEELVEVSASVSGGLPNIVDIYPLAPLQEGLLFHKLLDEQAADPYVLPLVLKVSSQDRLHRLLDALQRVVDRHDVLRTSLVWEGLAQPVQVVQRRASIPIEQVTFSSASAVEAQLEQWMSPEAQRIPLTAAPLLRIRIAADPASEGWYLLLQIHHLTCDHESLETLLEEWIQCYDGREAELPVPMPYRLHVAATVDRDSEGDAQFFRSMLNGITQPTTPFQLTDVKGGSGRIATEVRQLPADLLRRLRVESRKRATSVATLMHAAWSLLVGSASGHDDVVFGTLLSGRLTSPAGGGRVLGPFINTLPIRVRLNGSVESLIVQVKESLQRLVPHEHASLALAQRCVELEADRPLFSSLLNYLHSRIDLQHSQPWSDLGVEVVALREWTNYPIAVSIDDRPDAMSIMAQTDRRLPPGEILASLEATIRSLVDALEHTPSRYALSLQVITEYERHRIVNGFNNTSRTLPAGERVETLFTQQVERTPDAIAVTEGASHLTYRDLNDQAERVASVLVHNGVKVGDRVIVMLPRTAVSIASQLAVLKVGATYVPIDPELPLARQRLVMAEADASIILCNEWSGASLAATGQRWLDVESASQMAAGARTPAASSHLPAVPAYMMFTSGSTGIPKGVVVPHEAIIRLALNSAHASINHRDRVAHCSNPAFDAATFEIWGALLNGARIHIVPREVLLDPAQFSRELSAAKITVLFLTTSLFNQYANTDPGMFRNLRAVLFGGEAADARAVQKVLRGPFPPSLLVNAYGPTESTTFATYYPVTTIPAQARSLPIGYPIGNTQIYVLNGAGELVPVGGTGEIYIGGLGVSLGYFKQPVLTSERFIADRFGQKQGGRLYRTGDLGRWHEGGHVEYLGRKDQQIKIRGFRMELGEIEAQIARLGEVKEVAVIARESEAGYRQLVAYVTMIEGANAWRASEMRSSLQQVLPEYMIPSAIVCLPAFPLTANGKLDHRALPVPDINAYAGEHFEAPASKLEHDLAAKWLRLLGVSRVGRHDHFFELGGNSLLAVRLVAATRDGAARRLTVGDVYRYPRLREMAGFLAGSVDATDSVIDLKREAALPTEWAGLVRNLSPQDRTVLRSAKAVLFTGATGFVGRFLLYRFLMETNATVYCLVRAGNDGQAQQRLVGVLRRWDLWRESFSGRCVGLAGDLRRDRLGLSEDAYSRLSREVESVFHCGTSMNHLESYEMAREANVEGAKRIVSFCARSRLKTVNNISTLGVFNPREGGARPVDESTPIEGESHRHSSGYAGSKWVAEQVFLNATSIGIPCNTFRLGLVWADSALGRYDELQYEYRLIKSALLMRVGIEGYRHALAPISVDYVAKAVFALTARYTSGGGIFHLSGRGRVEGLFEICNEHLRTGLALLPDSLWWPKARRTARRAAGLPISPFIEESADVESAMQGRSWEREVRALQIESTRTRLELESMGIGGGDVDEAGLAQCIHYMLRSDPELEHVARSGNLMGATHHGDVQEWRD